MSPLQVGLEVLGAALSLAIGVWAFVRLRGWSVRRRRERDGLCAGCGYDLRGTVDRCPECGASIDDPGSEFMPTAGAGADEVSAAYPAVDGIDAAVQEGTEKFVPVARFPDEALASLAMTALRDAGLPAALAAKTPLHGLGPRETILAVPRACADHAAAVLMRTPARRFLVRDSG
ncbi:MAG TPA: hypothetical protein VFB66_12420 [Tepidisphaeraceae bacterium]|nr:hypothetical protein [Tepidisphaeraceae bacterium]